MHHARPYQPLLPTLSPHSNSRVWHPYTTKQRPNRELAEFGEMSSLSRRACYKCGNVGHYAGGSRRMCSGLSSLLIRLQKFAHHRSACAITVCVLVLRFSSTVADSLVCQASSQVRSIYPRSRRSTNPANGHDRTRIEWLPPSTHH